jgi:RND family efflux transporter MFP subunit
MKTYFLKSKCTAFVLSVAVIYGCTHGRQPEKNDPSMNVTVETVVESNAATTLDYVGVIEERSSTALGFPTLGTIDKIYVSEGDFVSAGQLLAKLDPISAQDMLDAAEATLRQAQDGYKRLKSIYDKGSLPEVQMVDIETKLQQAQSSYNITKKNLKNCTLYSPVSGVVGKTMAETGENALIGKPVLTILDVSSVKAGISVPEGEISLIPAGCKSEITVAALRDKVFHGTGIEKSVSVNMISHTYPAYVTVPNPKRELLPGMICKIVISTGNRPSVITVPINIVQTTSDGKKFVWMDDMGTAKRMIITTGMAKGNRVVVTSGLSAGDRIITEGYQKVSEGGKINVK